MNELEQKAADAILDAMDSIRNIDERGKLSYNTDELVQAVHVLQSFVKQHVLHRVDPKYWADWWDQNENND